MLIHDRLVQLGACNVTMSQVVPANPAGHGISGVSVCRKVDKSWRPKWTDICAKLSNAAFR